MKIEVYGYTFNAVIDPLYKLNDNHLIEILLFELVEDGYKQYTLYSSNERFFVKNFKAGGKYEGTAIEMSTKEDAIQKIQRRWSKYLKEGYTEDIVALELQRTKKLKDKLTTRYNYLKKLRKESLTKVPKKFIWCNYEEIVSPIKVTYDN